MRLHVTYTGGTIGMVDSPRGLVPGADMRGWFTELLAQASGSAPTLASTPTATLTATPAATPSEIAENKAEPGTICPPISPASGLNTPISQLSWSELAPLIDSSNATPASWQRIVEDIRAAAASPAPPDAHLVLHGTDTMSYTAAALSYALSSLPAPVVITGSQLPLGTDGSDAADNVRLALRALTSFLTPIADDALCESRSSDPSASTASPTWRCAGPRTYPLALAFGSLVLAGNRSTKSSSWDLRGFDSPSAPALFDATEQPVSAPIPAPAHSPALTRLPAPGCGWPSPKPYESFDVPVIDIVPGMSPARLSALLTPAPQAVILRGYGVGNIPSDIPELVDLITSLTADGALVAVASQCHQARVELGHYETGDAAARAGAVGIGDMTLEAAYAKIQFLLSQGLRGRDLATWLTRSIAGEVTEIS